MTSRIKEQEITRLEMETEKMRSNLLRSVSHDIRTPLTSIMGNASAILDNDEKLDRLQTRTLLEDIRKEAEWLNRIVENILSITKINSDVAKIRKEPELAEEIASSAVNKFHRRYPEVPVRASVPEEALLVPMDAVLIEQVLFWCAALQKSTLLLNS
jgi:two-component system sensor histidine kinase KdpD